MKSKEMTKLKKTLRAAIADYMKSEGCGCCGDRQAHCEHQAKLGKLLGVPKYRDGSGYDFSKYATKTKP